MKQEILDKCCDMLNSPDAEMQQLGKLLFIESYPTLTDYFALDMRVRSTLVDREGIFTLNMRKSQILNEIKGEVWGTMTHGR